MQYEEDELKALSPIKAEPTMKQVWKTRGAGSFHIEDAIQNENNIFSEGNFNYE